MHRMGFALCLSATLVACDDHRAGAKVKDETADEFVARANSELTDIGTEYAQATWVQLTYITPDTEALSARAYERVQETVAKLIAESKALRRRGHVARNPRARSSS